MQNLNVRPSEEESRLPVSDEKSLENLSEIVELLRRKKYITDQQIQYAVRIRSKIETPRTLLEVLKDLKYLTADQVKEAFRENRIPMCSSNRCCWGT